LLVLPGTAEPIVPSKFSAPTMVQLVLLFLEEQAILGPYYQLHLRLGSSTRR